jgi:RimJ/RimL family protein N-acetyltransferase
VRFRQSGFDVQNLSSRKPKDLETRQLKFDEKPALLAFLRRIYGNDSRHANEDFWNWHFPQSPFADNGNLPVWVALDGSKVVGLLGANEVRLNVAGREMRAIWILDLLIDPAYRRRGLAKRLALLAADFCPIVLGTNTAEQHSTELLLGLGWRHVLNLRRHRAVVTPSALLPRQVPKAVGQAADSIYGKFRRERSTGTQFRFFEVERFDERFDGLAERVRSQWPCFISRTAENLHWQYRAQPRKSFKVFGALYDDELVGYIVLYFRRPTADGRISKGAITDICYRRDFGTALIDRLIAAGLFEARRERVGVLVADSSDSELAGRLSAVGFSLSKGPLQLLVRSQEDLPELYDPTAWFLTRGDSDISIFEEPNR